MKGKNIKRLLCLGLTLCMTFSLAGMTAYADNDTEPAETISENSSEKASEETDETSEPDEDRAVAGKFNEDNKEVTNPARNIRLKVPQKNEITIGSTFQIQHSFTPLKSDDYITYKNMNKKIVKVDENGLVTAIGYGTAKIQLVTSKGLKKNIYFTVIGEEGETETVQGEAEAIELLDQSAMIRAGKTVQIDPVIYPLGIFDELTYKSNNTKVAKVSSTGLVTALSEGSAIITVSASNGVYAEFSVIVYTDILRGIDVSKWQGDINWKKVASSGIDFVMIRSSYGSEHTDEMLKKNVEGCEKYGIDYGFYHYTYAKTADEAKQEAKYFLSRIKNFDPTYPVVLDIEEEYFKKMSRKQVTDIIAAFMTELENAGYYAAVYSYAIFFRDNVDMSRIEKYDIWVASWGDEEKLNDSYDGHYGMWQYSAIGSVNGIDGEVDLNYAYKNYAAVIKNNKLNDSE